mgnify:CR=1 FL=1
MGCRYANNMLGNSAPFIEIGIKKGLSNWFCKWLNSDAGTKFANEISWVGCKCVNDLLGSSAPYIEIGILAITNRKDAITNPTHHAPTHRGSSGEIDLVILENKKGFGYCKHHHQQQLIVVVIITILFVNKYIKSDQTWKINTTGSYAEQYWGQF